MSPPKFLLEQNLLPPYEIRSSIKRDTYSDTQNFFLFYILSYHCLMARLSLN